MKASTATKEKETQAGNANLPATTTQGAAPAFLQDRIVADAGKGVSTDAADNQVPMVYVLQTNSPQVNDRDPAYVEGASPGCIWMRGYDDPIVDGETGAVFQPCYFYKEWVEWVPRKQGGGFVGRHADRPPQAEMVPDPEKPRTPRWLMPAVDGVRNEVKETRSHAGIFHIGSARVPYVIPLTGSGHSVSREWMFKMTSKKTSSGAQVPSFARLYKLTTRQRKNKDGSWFVLAVEDAGWVGSVQDYEAGSALQAAFASGEKKAAAPVADVDGDGDAGTVAASSTGSEPRLDVGADGKVPF